MFIGLMGVSSDNVLITPSGKELFKVPNIIARVVQRVQHKIAQLTWK